MLITEKCSISLLIMNETVGNCAHENHSKYIGYKKEFHPCICLCTGLAGDIND